MFLAMSLTYAPIASSKFSRIDFWQRKNLLIWQKYINWICIHHRIYIHQSIEYALKHQKHKRNLNDYMVENLKKGKPDVNIPIKVLFTFRSYLHFIKTILKGKPIVPLSFNPPVRKELHHVNFLMDGFSQFNIFIRTLNYSCITRVRSSNSLTITNTYDPSKKKKK